MKKIIKNRSYRVVNVINNIPRPPFKELLTVKDFTSSEEDRKESYLIKRPWTITP